MRLRISLRRFLTLFAPVIVAVTLLGAGLNATAAQAASYNGYFVFTKNSADPTNSRLTWVVYRTDVSPHRVVEQKTWRAGSGNGTKDSCAVGRGWLPNGKYGGTYYPAYDSVIKGPAIYLSDATCSRGTSRTALFIHSEMTAGGGQNCRYESQCWNGDSDYKSNGCIKLAPADMREAAALFDKWYAAGPVSNKKWRYSEMLYVR